MTSFLKHLVKTINTYIALLAENSVPDQSPLKGQVLREPSSVSQKRKRMDGEKKEILRKKCRVTSSILQPAAEFLDLPHDIHHLIISQFLDPVDILSLAHTSNALRALCYDLYLERQGVLQIGICSESDICKRHMTIRITEYIPRLALFILLSALSSDHFSRVRACLWIDLASLYYFEDMIFNFLEESQLVVAGLYFSYGCKSLQALSSEVPGQMSRLLASIGTSCTLLHIWERSESNRAMTAMRFSRPNSGSNRIHNIHRAADSVLSMDLTLSIFDSPSTRTLAPLLLKGSSITSLVLSCANTAMLLNILDEVQMPALLTMGLFVLSDVSGISFPSQFFSQHPTLQRLTVTNSGSDSVNGVPQESILNLPPLRAITISSNYYGWTMTDESLLSSVVLPSIVVDNSKSEDWAAFNLLIKVAKLVS
ncbi:hypothetical protein JR316_0005320 [Psilocybe cubensis]|uniref:Uncharacterized protein n=1 Tax=Psilocybe cubensis TaxID=181762 RepID=A0ACB8H5P0_PSICU|nr:hypothetical protein JR316_0005320 [Psilocybe cubensis]KAH9483216.1 hypothetical protein JR316_0005320 [Psilocybe cubensis]